jgi:uncharacterized membrane protein
MARSIITSNLGLYVYGGAGIFLGLLGLVSGDFATTWQNVGPNIPLRVPLAYLTAVIELAAGIALLLPRTARAGALILTIVCFHAHLGSQGLCESRQLRPHWQCL